MHRVRVHGVRTGALLIWCVSHTPSSTAVQRSQEELLRNVTAVGDATADLLLEYRQDFFLFIFFLLNCLLLVEIHNMNHLCSCDSN